MVNRAGRGGALACRYAPRLRRRRHEHQTHGRADAPQRIVVVRRCGAAARVLRSVPGLIEIGLLDAHLVPINFELLGNQHGQRRLDALADFRVLRHDRDDVVRDLDERVGHEGDGRRLLP